jgi:hypothetical protein
MFQVLARCLGILVQETIGPDFVGVDLPSAESRDESVEERPIPQSPGDAREVETLDVRRVEVSEYFGRGPVLRDVFPRSRIHASQSLDHV